jgi:hypothetical protein
VEEGQEVVESSTESAPSETAPAPSGEAAPSSAGQISDLESMQKFRFGGKEWTPKEFQGAYMMQADYTRKTQALAEERKYYDNLSADLGAVKQNPSLAAKFKEIYPSKFHGYLDYVSSQQEAQPGNPQNKYANLDPSVIAEFNEVKAYMTSQKVAAINAELDARFKGLSEKYPYADEEAAIARAQAAQAKGIQLNDKTWDAIWKAVNDKNVEIFKKYGSAQVNKQKSANQKGKDAASGGGIPGQAPRQPKTIKEATKYALEEMQNS